MTNPFSRISSILICMSCSMTDKPTDKVNKITYWMLIVNLQKKIQPCIFDSSSENQTSPITLRTDLQTKRQSNLYSNFANKNYANIIQKFF